MGRCSHSLLDANSHDGDKFGAGDHSKILSIFWSLYHKPSDEFEVSSGLYLFEVSSGLYLLARVGKLATAPGKKISRILPLELRGNSGNSTIQQAAVLAHVLTVFGLSIKQFAKLHIGFDLALAHRAENFEHLLGAGEVVAYLSIVADVDKEVRLERVDGFVAAGIDTLLEAIDCTRLDGLKFGMGRHNSIEAERRVGYSLILYPIAR